jgi:hypothetical protein
VAKPRSSWLSNATKFAAIAIATLLLFNGLKGAGFLHRDRIQRDELAYAVRLANGGPFLTVSPLLQGTFPQVTELGANWASPYGHQWMALGAHAKLRSSNPTTRGDGERLRTRAAHILVEDLAERRPVIVAVARSHGSYGLGVDWVSFLRADSSFDRAWSRYCLVHSTHSWNVFKRCENPEARLPPSTSE